MRSAESRQTVLDKCRTLGDLDEDHAYRKVFIRPDMTKVQRDLDYQRRQAAKQRRAAKDQTAAAKRNNVAGRHGDQNPGDGHAAPAAGQNQVDAVPAPLQDQAGGNVQVVQAVVHN